MELKILLNINKKMKNIKDKILNKLTKNGKKETSEKIFKKSLKFIQKFNYQDHNDILKIALINTSPILNIRSIKTRKKQKKQYPYVLNNKTRLFFAINFILNFTTKKSNSLFYKKLANEFILASKNESESNKQKTSLHERAFIFKKFAKYRWF